MSLSENFNTAKNFAKNAALSAADKAKSLATIAKMNIAIYAEQDHIKKAEQELGKLYYRDYAVGEEMDMAEYLPWCQKIDDSNKLIAEMNDTIDDLREAMSRSAAEAPAEKAAPAAEPAEEVIAKEVPAEEAPASQAPAEEVPTIEIEVVDTPNEEN